MRTFSSVICRRQSDSENDSVRHRNRDRFEREREREREERRRRPDRELDQRRRRSDRDGRQDTEHSDRPERERVDRNRERSLDADSGDEQGGRRREWQNERRRDSWGGEAEERSWTRGRRGRVGAWRETGEGRRWTQSLDTDTLDTDPHARACSNPVEQSGQQRWERDDSTDYRPRLARDDARGKRRRSTEDEMEEGRTLNLNPTDVPRADSYFLVSCVILLVKGWDLTIDTWARASFTDHSSLACVWKKVLSGLKVGGACSDITFCVF